MSQITVSDGFTVVNIDQNATLLLSQGFDPVRGGSTLHRMINGTAVKQTHWDSTKRRVTVSGEGTVPPRLNAIDYGLELTLTLRNPDDAAPDGPGVQYTVFADPPAEQWDINKAGFTWSLVGEEV